MDLVGSGRRLSSAELLAAANKLGVDVATLRAILQVETAGAGFDAKKRTRPVVSRGMIGLWLYRRERRKDVDGWLEPHVAMQPRSMFAGGQDHIDSIQRAFHQARVAP